MAAIPPMSYPRERGTPVSEVPLENQGPRPFYPPVCLRSHWDPTMILQRTLPDSYVPQPLDPRPWAKICLRYTTAGENGPAPQVDPNVVLPSGGQFYPPTKYANSIDDESQLRRLDRPLGTCEANQWEPTLRSDMFNSRILVERTRRSDPSQIAEVAYPKALLRAGPYPCRAEADAVNVAIASEFMFNNATKQDRYKLMGKSNRPLPPEEVLAAAQEDEASAKPIASSRIANMRPDLIFDTPREGPSATAPRAG